jgi:hypothetical protein
MTSAASFSAALPPKPSPSLLQEQPAKSMPDAAPVNNVMPSVQKPARSSESAPVSVSNSNTGHIGSNSVNFPAVPSPAVPIATESKAVLGQNKQTELSNSSAISSVSASGPGKAIDASNPALTTAASSSVPTASTKHQLELPTVSGSNNAPTATQEKVQPLYSLLMHFKLKTARGSHFSLDVACSSLRVLLFFAGFMLGVCSCVGRRGLAQADPKERARIFVTRNNRSS